VVKLGPSILTADFGNIAEQIRAAEAGGADYIHLDVMDGRFVPPITFGPLLIEAVRKATKLPLDVHLMIEDPESQFDAVADAGGDIINFHVEATVHADRLLRRIHTLGKRAGICLNPATPLSTIEEVLDVTDQVIVMMINPGWGGQKLLPPMLDKVRRLRAMLDEHGVSPAIELDGGVKANNLAACVAAGGQALVCGSSVYNADASPQVNLRALREAASRVPA
jgi:ribulose-phosphate 3-epimerase